MKKTHLLEIIQEEIALALNELTNVIITNKKGEDDTLPYNTSADKLGIGKLKQDSNILSIKTTGGQKIKEDQNNILVPSNLIRSYITELIYSAEDMEYTPEMVKKLKVLKGGLSGGKISVEDALDIIQQTIDITEDDIDAVEALGQAVDYDDTIVDAARDIKGLNEDQLDEMAKITGRLEAAIKKVLSSNSDLEGLPLKKAIKADAEVEDALEGDTMYDNQLNKFIALVRGNREVGQRGRKADPNKVKAEPKAKAEKAKAEPKAEKASTKDMDDEDKEASKNIGSDATAKELGKTAPKDKIEKFNLGLKFIKKYKDDKPKVDAYLKKAKEEYKFSTAMLKDLKKTAGRDVSI